VADLLLSLVFSSPVWHCHFMITGSDVTWIIAFRPSRQAQQTCNIGNNTNTPRQHHQISTRASIRLVSSLEPFILNIKKYILKVLKSKNKLHISSNVYFKSVKFQPEMRCIYSTLHKKEKIIDIDIWTVHLKTLSDFTFLCSPKYAVFWNEIVHTWNIHHNLYVHISFQIF
jgi:hypothetical protein